MRITKGTAAAIGFSLGVLLSAAIVVLFAVLAQFIAPDIVPESVPSSAPEISASEPSEDPAPSVPEESEPDLSEPAESAVYEGALELPIEGATGYAAAAIGMYAEPSGEGELLATLSPGQAFVICGERGGWWQVRMDGLTGWVRHDSCLINLPDVIPSIVYRNTNASASLFRSSGREIPGITGQALYDASSYNARFGYETCNMAVLYATAKKLANAQDRALADGYTLVLYEGFRPYQTQIAVAEALSALAETDETVRAGIASEPWSINWFIATGVSTHQQGCAVDVSLARVTAVEEDTCGPYVYTRVAAYEELEMPTAMHELSSAAASLTRPVASTNLTAWQEVKPAASMTEAALALGSYCTAAGLTPLASEWWHFNDLDRLVVADESWRGDFTLAENVSEEIAAG